jgi:hypothetical protein
METGSLLSWEWKNIHWLKRTGPCRSLGDWIGGTEFADDEGAEDDVALDTGFGHDDVDMRDMLVDKKNMSGDNNNERED